MADLKRSTKPVSQWTSNELLAFNIRVEDAGVEAFFNIPQLPTPTVSTTILDNFDKSHLNLCRTATVYKRSAEEPPSSIDLSLFLLNLLEYVTIGHSLHGLWAKLSFLMAGQRIIARIDLFLKSVDGLHEYLLIFHEDNHSNQDPEAQVIAKAIIAFDHNNCQRVKSALVDAVAVLAYPQEETTVLRLIPPVPNQELYSTEGMHPLANRRSVFQCLEAFKAVIE